MLGILLSLSFVAGVVGVDEGVLGTRALPAVVPLAMILALLPTRRQRLTALACSGALLLGVFVGLSSRSATTPALAGANTGTSFRAEVIGSPRRFPEMMRVELRRLDQVGVVHALFPPYPVVSRGDLVRVGVSTSDANASPRTGTADEPVRARWVEREGTTAGLWQSLWNRIGIDIRERIQRSVPAPASELVLGVMIGDDEGMVASTRAAFRRSGMSHITAVSGWNVALVIGMLSVLGGRRIAISTTTLAASVVGVWCYAYLVEMGATVTRATLMGTLLLLARFRGRPSDGLTALSLAAALMVAFEPAIISDVGFQLSCVATLGMILASTHLDQRPGWQLALALPVVAQIVVLPLLLYHFGAFSPLSPLANLLAAPFIPAIMLLGSLALIASLLQPSLAFIFGALTWIPASLVIGIAETFGSTRWHAGPTRPISSLAMIGYYVCLATAYLVLRSWIMLRTEDGDRSPVAGPV